VRDKNEINVKGIDMKFQGKNNSYFHNNFLYPRDKDSRRGTPLIDGSGEDVICRLNGYAIIPMEEYYKLKGEEISEDELKKIAEMDEKLANNE
jgi:hypothetical protein